MYALATARVLGVRKNSMCQQRHFSDSKYDKIRRKCNATSVALFKMSKIEEKRLNNVSEGVAKAKAAFDNKEYKRSMVICSNGNYFYCGIDDIHSPQCWCNTEIQEALNELSTSLTSLQHCKKSLTALRTKDLENWRLRQDIEDSVIKNVRKK